MTAAAARLADAGIVRAVCAGPARGACRAIAAKGAIAQHNGCCRADVHRADIRALSVGES